MPSESRWGQVSDTLEVVESSRWVLGTERWSSEEHSVTLTAEPSLLPQQRCFLTRCIQSSSVIPLSNPPELPSAGSNSDPLIKASIYPKKLKRSSSLPLPSLISLSLASAFSCRCSQSICCRPTPWFPEPVGFGHKCLENCSDAAQTWLALLKSKTHPCGDGHFSQPSLSRTDPHSAPPTAAASQSEKIWHLLPARACCLVSIPCNLKLDDTARKMFIPRKAVLLSNKGPTLQQPFSETTSDLYEKGKRRKLPWEMDHTNSWVPYHP